MKAPGGRYLAIVCLAVVALGVLLFFLHPLAPLVLLASLLIQTPIVWMIARSSFKSGYRDRAFARKEQYKEDGDAAAWLVGEEKEAASVGFKYWSTSGRMLSLMHRAEALHALERDEEAKALAKEIQANKLSSYDKQQLDALLQALENTTQ